MTSLLLVAAGGALGALCRYGAGLLSTVLFGRGFPVGTLMVNVAGCFIIGAVYAAMAEYEAGDHTTVTDSVYQKLLKALDDCHTILGAEGDLQAGTQEGVA